MSIAKLLVEVGVKESNLKKEIGEDNDLFREFAAEAKNATKEVKTQEQALTSLVARTGNHKGELRRYTQEIQNLTIAYRQLSDEDKNSEFGRQMAQQINEAKAKAAELTDTIGDLKAEVRRMADDNFNMNAFKQGVGVVRDGLSATVSVMTLFGAEADKMQAVITKVTAIMTTANAVISVFTALQKESYIRIIANKLASTLLTAAMNKYTAATGRAVAATGALAVAQKALPILAIVGTLTAVIGILYEFISASDDAKKAEEERANAIEEAKRKQDESARAIGRSAGQMRVTFEKLTGEYKNLKTQAQKTEWIQKNASEFAKLGLKINNVSDAERIFTQNTGDVVKALRLRAQAMALEQQMLQAYEDYYSKEEQIDSQKPKVWKKGEEVDDATAKAAGVRTKSERKQIDLARGVEPDASDVKSITKEYADLSKREIDKLNAYEAKQNREKNAQIRKNNEAALNKRINFIKKKTKELQDMMPESLSGKMQLQGNPEYKTETKGGGSTGKKTEEAKTEIEKLRAELKKLEDTNRDAYNFEQIVDYENKVKELKQKIADKEFLLKLDISPAEASMDALYEKYDQIIDYMEQKGDDLAYETKQNLTDIASKLKKEIFSRDFSKFGTKLPNWRQNSSSDDLKKRQESLRGKLQETTPQNNHAPIEEKLQKVTAQIAFETDESKLDELKAQYMELQNELAATPFQIIITPEDQAVKDEIETIQKELDARELTMGLDDTKLREQLKILDERAAKIQLDPYAGYSSFEKATGVPEKEQKDLSGANGTDAQLDQLQKLMDFYDNLKTSLQQLQAEYGKLGPAGVEAFNTLQGAVQKVEDTQKELMETTEEVNKSDKKRNKSKKAWNGVADSIGSVGDALSAVSQLAGNSPELNVAGIIAQAIAQVMVGFATASAAAAQTGNPWVWVAFVASGLALALSTAAQISSATDGYAQGGLIGGRSFSGDKATIHVNSGESVLTNEHMERVWKFLNSSEQPGAGGGFTGSVQWVLKGSDLYGSLKNYSKQMSFVGKDIGIR